jgi:hypothetical protein
MMARVVALPEGQRLTLSGGAGLSMTYDLVTEPQNHRCSPGPLQRYG